MSDLSFDEVVEAIDTFLHKYPLGSKIFVKWTCPECGERCISDVANTVNASGYVHTEKADGTPCGTHYTGGRYGLYATLIIKGGSHV